MSVRLRALDANLDLLPSASRHVQLARPPILSCKDISVWWFNRGANTRDARADRALEGPVRVGQPLLAPNAIDSGHRDVQRCDERTPIVDRDKHNRRARQRGGARGHDDETCRQGQQRNEGQDEAPRCGWPAMHGPTVRSFERRRNRLRRVR